MCGWNEPEKIDVQSVEVKVDAALIERRHPVRINGIGSRCALVTHAIKNIRILCEAEP